MLWASDGSTCIILLYLEGNYLCTGVVRASWRITEGFHPLEPSFLPLLLHLLHGNERFVHMVLHK